jgi:hypothetical protein
MGKLAQWLPSVTVQLARAAGLKYNQAAFRVPPAMSKPILKMCADLHHHVDREREREGGVRRHIQTQRGYVCVCVCVWHTRTRTYSSAYKDTHKHRAH